MLFTNTTFEGAFMVCGEALVDERGYFARVFDADEFSERGLCAAFPEHSIAYNARRGIIRGMHFQTGGSAETKLVRCLTGTIFDVIVDIRADSPTFGTWESFELGGDGLKQLYIPQGFAHGYQTLSEESTVHYLISHRYSADEARGYHYASPELGIGWPLNEPTTSKRDRMHPPFTRTR